LPEDTIKIEGLSIRYWTNVGGLGGDDKRRRTVVLFHGNAFSLDSWKKTKTLEVLSSNGYRVASMDHTEHLTIGSLGGASTQMSLVELALSTD
jgi:hypothetical protein